MGTKIDERERRRQRRRRAKCAKCTDMMQRMLEVLRVSKHVSAIVLDRTDVATRYGLPKMLTTREWADYVGERYNNNYYRTLRRRWGRDVVTCGGTMRVVLDDHNCNGCKYWEHEVPTDPMLSLAEFAEWFGINYNTAWKLANHGQIPGAIKVGRRWQVNPHKLLEQVGGNG